MKQGTKRDVSDDARDVACDHQVIPHHCFTSSLHPTIDIRSGTELETFEITELYPRFASRILP